MDDLSGRFFRKKSDESIKFWFWTTLVNLKSLVWFQITTVSNSVYYIQYVVEIYNFWRRSKLDKTNKSNQKPDHLSMTA